MIKMRDKQNSTKYVWICPDIAPVETKHNMEDFVTMGEVEYFMNVWDISRRSTYMRVSVL